MHRATSFTFHSILVSVGLMLALGGCAWFAAGQRQGPGDGRGQVVASSAPTQLAREMAMTIMPLPGGLDATPVFNSNSPEVVTQAGILLSTLAPGPYRAEEPIDPKEPHQDFAFSGNFGVFSHHIAKDAQPGDRLLCLGLLAYNPGNKPVLLKLLSGASYLSQPDALFRPLDPIVADPTGAVFAGPGDRVATDLLHGRSPMAPTAFLLAPHSSQLIYNLPIPTDVAILPPINGRTTQLRLQSDGPVRLAEVAAFAQRDDMGVFVKPLREDFEALVASRVLAGPRDAAATPYDPDAPPPRGFKYGRVAGVSIGETWTSNLFGPESPPASGQSIAVPIAAVYLNRLGTGQNQSASVRTRYADTAFQAHGNYGVRYDLKLNLKSPDAAGATYLFTLSHPARATGEKPTRAVVYLDPPNKPVTFRGPIRVRYRDAAGIEVTHFNHVVLRHGEEMKPFETITLPPSARTAVIISLIYPADATPPQLLTITRE